MLKCISLAFKIMVLWDVTPCRLVDRYHTAGKTYYPFYTFPPWRQRQQVPSKHWHLPARLHLVTFHNIMIFTLTMSKSETSLINLVPKSGL